MNKLHFNYWMEISYSEPVTECHYTIRCLPKDTDMQKISDLKIEITPDHDYQRSEDSFGNLTIYDNLYFLHSRFTFHISGIVETWLAVSEREAGNSAIYRYPHGLNRAGEGLKTYFEQIMQEMSAASEHQPSSPAHSAYYTAVQLMHYLHRDFTYEKGATCMDTSAEQAWELGKGVCQDYTHIFIALCHQAGIPARYVTSMMVGEGHTHAWVEILDHGFWYGMDPTNDCIAAGTYIKIGCGRDAKDCVINKGIVKGGGRQNQTVMVRVEELS